MVRRSHVAILILLLPVAMLLPTGLQHLSGPQKEDLKSKATSYPAHASSYDNLTEIDFISINGNEEFRQTAQEYGWPGSGMEWDPYIIEGYHFRNTYHMFVVASTDCYWIFRNNVLDGIDDHWCIIVISNLRNADISNNVFMQGAVGIHCIRVNESRFIGNRMYNQSFDGVFLEYSHRITIRSNRFHDSGEGGVYAWQASTQNIIESNEVYNCPYGLMLLAGATDNTLRDNHLYNLSNTALDIQTADNSIRNNRIHDVGGNALAIGSPGQTIRGNLVYNNSGYAINAFTTSGGLTIENNVLLFNTAGGINLQRSTGSVVLENDMYHNGAIQAVAYEGGNSFSHNYWHEWIGNDTNGDMIIDVEKAIYGGKCNDSTPALLPNNPVPDWYSFTQITGPPPEPIETTETSSTSTTSTPSDSSNATSTGVGIDIPSILTLGGAAGLSLVVIILVWKRNST